MKYYILGFCTRYSYRIAKYFTELALNFQFLVKMEQMFAHL